MKSQKNTVNCLSALLLFFLRVFLLGWGLPISGFASGAEGVAERHGVESMPGFHDVRDFGAKSDGSTINTVAIQRAIDMVAKEGGGRLIFPAPGKYLTGTIFLKDNVTLEISAGATLLGSQQSLDYPTNVGHCPYITENSQRALIYARNARNIGLTGRGTISGNGEPPVLLNKPVGEIADRPMLVRFEDCSHIRVDQLTMTECFSWNLHFARCHDVRVDGLCIPNRRQDGIDLESCEDVTISNCNIKSGDDAIAILSNRELPCRNVTIANCILLSKWAGIRLGPLSHGDINNITVDNCVIRDCQGGGIKIAMLEGGEIRNCNFSNLTMDNVVAPIVVMLVGNYPQTDNPEHPRMPLGKISHLSFSHITGTAAGKLAKEPDAQSIVFLHGHPQQWLEEISLSDIDLVMAGGGAANEGVDRSMLDADVTEITNPGTWPDHRAWGVSPAAAMYVRHVNGLNLNHVRFRMAKPDQRPALYLRQSSDINVTGLSVNNPSLGAPSRVTFSDCQDAIVSGCLDGKGGKAFATIKGENNRGIKITGNNLKGFAAEIQSIPDVSK